MRTFIIDGNFLLLRILKANQDLMFRDKVKEDAETFTKTLCAHLANQVSEIKSYCDNIVICKDAHSWRKSFPIKRFDNNPPAKDYKANRIKSEEEVEAGPDMDFFFPFTERVLKRICSEYDIAYTCVPGAEGDDAIYAWTTYLAKQGKYSIVYATDSDLNMLLNKYVMIHRQVRTKLSPTRGEIMCSKDYYKEYIDSNNMMSIFSENIQMWQAENVLMHDRKLGEQVFTPNPYWGVFFKIFAGDAKDNVPPCFVFTNNGRTATITEKRLEKALGAIFLDYTTDEDMLYNDELYRNVIQELAKVCKVYLTDDEKKLAFDIAIQNRKLLYLNYKEIPTEVLEGLKANINANKNLRAKMSKMSYNGLLATFGLSDTNYFKKF